MAAKKRLIARPLFHAIFWPCFLVVTLTATRLIWGWHAEHRFEETKARLHAAGVRLDLSEFPDGNALPRDENAFNDFLDAILGFDLPPEQRQLIWIPPSIPEVEKFLKIEFSSAQISAIKSLSTSHEESLSNIDTAEMRPQTVWPRPSDASHDKSPSPVAFLNLSHLLIRRSLLAHQEGRDIDAMHDLRRVLTLCRVASHAPKGSFTFFSANIRRQVAQAVIHVLPKLDLVQAANQEEAKHLLTALQDDAEVRHGLVLGLEGDIASGWPKLLVEASPRWSPLSPRETESVTKRLQAMAYIFDVARAPTWRKALVAAADPPSMPPMRMDVATPIESMQAILTDLTHTRAAALLLAAQIHEHINMGPAQTIGDLLDENLPRIPLDPFADNDQPLHFRLESAGVVIWSVGEDGKDDGGAIGSKTDLVFQAAPAQE